MKIEKKIEKWCRDNGFMDFADKRLQQELADSLADGSYDPLFEEMDAGFEYDDRYIIPMVEYMTCRLHLARLKKDRRQREQGIWQVWCMAGMLGQYVQVFSGHFHPLMAELRADLMPMLHREYVKQLNK